MTDPNDWGDRGEEQHPAEGVRIIRAEEAQAALEAGAAVGRRPDDELRVGMPPAPEQVGEASGSAGAGVVPESDEEPGGDFSSDFVSSFSSGGSSVPAGNEWAGADWTWTGSEESDPETAGSPAGAGSAAGSSGPAAGATEQEEMASDPPGVDAVEDGDPTVVAPVPGWLPDTDENPAWSPSAPHQPTGAGTRVPAWDSPLDDAQRISVAPGSGRPPEAWAASPYAARGVSRSRPSGPVSTSPARGTADQAGAQGDASSSSGGSDAGPSREGSAPSPARHEAGPNEAVPDETSAPSAPPDEGIPVTGGFGTDLPHWTDPPTGEAPRLLPGDEAGEQSDDLEAWRAVSQDTGVRWRDDADDWNDIGGIDELGSDETRVGDMDPSRAEPNDLYSFDEDFDRLDEERSGQHRLFDNEYAEEDEIETAEPPTDSPRAPRGRSGSRGAHAAGAVTDTTGTSTGGRDLTSAVAVGVGLIVLLIIGFAVGSKALLVLSAAVMLACSIEAFAMVHRRGFKPATLLGVAGVVGVVFAAYWRGTEALSIVTAVMFVATTLWYLLGVVDARPLANVSASLMIYLWIGFLGSFAALLLRAPHGRGLFLGAVLPTVAADVVAYVVGSRIGSRTLAPWVSPSKTVEGVIAGGIAALVVGAVIGHEVAPWGGFKHGLLLGLVIAILAPLGDLFESMVKRDLAVKDSGSALPGHGGLLDRFDSMLIVLPAAYYLASLFNLHV